MCVGAGVCCGLHPLSTGSFGASSSDFFALDISERMRCKCMTALRLTDHKREMTGMIVDIFKALFSIVIASSIVGIIICGSIRARVL